MKRRRPLHDRVHISIGFLVLLGVLFYLDEGVGLLGPGLLACALHELGHILTVRALGGRVKRLQLTVVGAELVLDERYPLSYFREAAVALAGPVGSFLWAFLASLKGAWLLAGLAFGQGAFNLLPILPLDGGRALYACVSAWKDSLTAEKVLTVTSALLSGVLVGTGLVLARQYGNVTLLITAAWLLTGTLETGRK